MSISQAIAPRPSARPFRMIKGVSSFLDLKDGVMAGSLPPGVDEDGIYYVDANNGDDENDGKSWDTAVATIDTAVDLWNALIDWSATPMRYGCIFVAPGVYAEAPSIPYYCYMIGCGWRGTDTAAEIHPTTGSCFTGTMLGTVFVNLRFEVNTAVDCLNIGICNNSGIIGCTFTNGAAVAANGLNTENCTHLWFEGNSVESGQTTGMAYGIYFGGGSNKFAHNVRIKNNDIFASTAGIFIQDTCTASQAIIGPGNSIWGAAKGIDDNNGTSRCYGNYISATDAIEHANSSTHCVGNHVSNNGTGAMETSGS